MRKSAFAVLATLLLTAAGAAFAGSSLAISADVPFAFTVADTTFEAGKYRVIPFGQGSSLLMIRRDDGRKGVIVMVRRHLQSEAAVGNPHLIFNRYGNKYFLSTVWSGSDTGREIQKSRHEREIALGVERRAETLIAAQLR